MIILIYRILSTGFANLILEIVNETSSKSIKSKIKNDLGYLAR